jgi:hypothetical protein
MPIESPRLRGLSDLNAIRRALSLRLHEPRKAA